MRWLAERTGTTGRARLLPLCVCLLTVTAGPDRATQQAWATPAASSASVRTAGSARGAVLIDAQRSAVKPRPSTASTLPTRRPVTRPALPPDRVPTLRSRRPAPKVVAPTLQPAHASAVPTDPPAPPRRALSLWRAVSAWGRRDLTDLAQRRPLLRFLNQKVAWASHEPDAWRAMALGSLLLGQDAQALRWLRIGFVQPRHDPLWLADLVAALFRASHREAAMQLARYALHRLHPWARRAAAHSAQPGSDLSRRQRETLRTYAQLLRVVQGPTRGAWRLADVLPVGQPAAVRADLLAAWNDDAPLASRAFAKGRSLRLRPAPPPSPDPPLARLAASATPGSVPLPSSSVPPEGSNATDPRPAKSSPATRTDSEDDEDDDEDDEDEDEDEDDDDDDSDADEEDRDGDADSTDNDDDSDVDDADSPLSRALAQQGAPEAAPFADDAVAEDESDEPDIDRPFALTAGIDGMDLGDYQVLGVLVRGDFSLRRLGLPRWGLGLRAGYALFSDTHDWLDRYDFGLELGELELAVVGRYRLPDERGRIELGVAANLRTTHAVPGAWLHAEYSPRWGFGSGLLFELNAGVNQVVADTNELRLVGARDRIQGGVGWDLTGREFLNVQLGWQRYHSRRREHLSDGYALYAEAGHRLRLANPGWNVRLSGYAEQNQLQPALPRWIARKVDPDDDIHVADIVIDGFAMIGLGTTLRRGLPGAAPADDRRLRYLADLWVGYLWPLHQLGFDVQAGLGYSLPKSGELSLSAFLSNSRFGGGRDGISGGMSLRWVY